MQVTARCDHVRRTSNRVTTKSGTTVNHVLMPVKYPMSVPPTMPMSRDRAISGVRADHWVNLQ